MPLQLAIMTTPAGLKWSKTTVLNEPADNEAMQRTRDKMVLRGI
jgi:hypothetical protein